MSFSFKVEKTLKGALGRSGVITTPHGQIKTPAFIPVGTKATLKSVLPESLSDLGAQAVLANAYHLYLQPGPEIVDQAPATTWGILLDNSRRFVTVYPNFFLIVAGSLVLVVLAFNLVGDALRDALDPRSER